MLCCLCLSVFIYVAKTRQNYEYKEDKFRIITYFTILVIYNGSKIYSLFKFLSISYNHNNEYLNIIIESVNRHFNVCFEFMFSTIYLVVAEILLMKRNTDTISSYSILDN